MIRTRTRRLVASLFCFGALVVAAGCSSPEQVQLGEYSGFLTTYSNLQPAGNASMRFLDSNNRLARYDRFVINAVEIDFMGGAVGENTRPEDLEELKAYMRQAIVDALEPEFPVVTGVGGTTGEIRVAITDVDYSSRVFNFRRGGLVMEAEVLDSVSSVQIAALVEAATGEGLRLGGGQRMDWFADARRQMDELAARFRAIVDEAHAKGN